MLSLQELLNKLAVVKTLTDVIAKRAKGSILHDFYSHNITRLHESLTYEGESIVG